MCCRHFINNFSHCLFSVYVVAQEWVHAVIFNPFARFEFDYHSEQLPESVEVFHEEALFESYQVNRYFIFFNVFQCFHANARCIIFQIKLRIVVRIVNIVILLVTLVEIFQISQSSIQICIVTRR